MRSFRAVAIGLHLAGLNLERDFVFSVGSFLRSGGDGFVVVENDAVEAVVDQVLKLGRSLGADGIDQHAGVGVRIVDGFGGAGSRLCGVDLVVGVGVAVLHQKIVQREIELVFADVVGKRVEDLAALLVPDVVLALHESERRLVADLAGAAAQVAIELVAEVAMHQIAAVLVRHDLQRGVLGEAFRHHVGTFDIGADELVGPPLVAKFVRGDEVGEVDVGGLHHAADEADAFGVWNGVGKGLGEGAVAGKLEDAVLVELVGTVDALIVVEAGAGAGEHVVDVVGVGGIVVDLERDIAVGPVVGLLPRPGSGRRCRRRSRECGSIPCCIRRSGGHWPAIRAADIRGRWRSGPLRC